MGLYEVSTFSFTSQQVFDRINLPADSKLRETVKLANPLSSEHEILRTTLIPNLLEVLAENINQNIEEVEIFELGRVFTPQEEKELPKERELLSGALMQKEEEDIWNLDAANFFTLKGKLEEYFAALNITDYEFISSQAATFHPGRTAEIRIGEKKAGIIGELHPDIVEEYELVPRTVLFELKFEVIVEAASDEVVYTELPKYPASTRDIALVVDQKVTANEIEEIIRKVAGELLEKIELFDLYQGEQLKAGTKSLAYSLTYRAVDRTLTDNEVNKLQSEIESELNQEVGAEIRQ